MKKGSIGIVGEYNPGNKTHQLLNSSLDWLQDTYNFDYEWVETTTVLKEGDALLRQFTGLWSAPGSPFKSLDGAVKAIEFARTNNIPHLGTCAGFQHTIIEFARNVLGYADAQHEEYDTNSSKLFISRLACSLSGRTMELMVMKNTLAHAAYQHESTTEDYYCNFGINPAFKEELNHPALKISGIDRDGEIRILENSTNRFFVATLFVPQSRTTKENPHPIIKKFVESCV